MQRDNERGAKMSPHSGLTENDNEHHERFLLHRKDRPRRAEHLPAGRHADRLHRDPGPVLLIPDQGALTIGMTNAINKTARGFAGPRAAIAPRVPA